MCESANGRIFFMENKLEQLLDEVFVICKHHKELSAATGELFNIFSLLAVDSCAGAKPL